MTSHDPTARRAMWLSTRFVNLCEIWQHTFVLISNQKSWHVKWRELHDMGQLIPK